MIRFPADLSTIAGMARLLKPLADDLLAHRAWRIAAYRRGGFSQEDAEAFDLLALNNETLRRKAFGAQTMETAA
jgi:hypothetical protein